MFPFILVLFSVTCITYFQVDEGQYGNHYKDNKRHGRSIAEVRNTGSERIVVNVMGHCDRGSRRAAVC